METKYIRLLSYENACKVIEFINLKKSNYASITTSGIYIIADNYDEIEEYIKSLSVRYELINEDPYTVQQKYISELKKAGVIK